MQLWKKNEVLIQSSQFWVQAVMCRKDGGNGRVTRLSTAWKAYYSSCGQICLSFLMWVEGEATAVFGDSLHALFVVVFVVRKQSGEKLKYREVEKGSTYKRFQLTRSPCRLGRPIKVIPARVELRLFAGCKCWSNSR